MLIVLRFLVGIGLGAELPVASTLVAEYAPKPIRGRVVVALEAFWALGWIMAALLGFFLIPTNPDGWRWALAAAAECSARMAASMVARSSSMKTASARRSSSAYSDLTSPRIRTPKPGPGNGWR